MKIKSLDLINFGKFNNYRLDFDDSFNLIYGLNESGKSTIHAFISFMLFGVNKANTKRKIKIKDYLSYKPINKNEYSGRMSFESSGFIYEIYRDFLNDTYFVSKNGLDITDEIKRENSISNKSIGEIILGLSRNVFNASTYISQSKDIYFDDFDDIKELLLKLKTNDEGEYNLSEAKNSIDDEIAMIGTENAKIKELYSLKKEIASLDRDISGLESSLEDTMSMLNKKDELNKKKENLILKKKDFLAEYNKAKEYYKKENLLKIEELKEKKKDFLNKNKNITSDDYEAFNELKKRLEANNSSEARRRSLRSFSYIFALLSIFALLYYFIRSSRITLYTSFAMAIVFLISFIFTKSKTSDEANKKLIDDKNAILDKYNIASDEDFISEYTKQRSSEMSQNYLQSFDEFLKTYSEKNFDELSEEKVLDYLSKTDEAAYDKYKGYSISMAEDEITKIDLELNSLETKLNYNDRLMERAYELGLRRDALDARYAELERRRKALSAASEIISSLITEINTSYMPKIIAAANKYLEMFSDNKYNFFLLDESFTIMLRDKKTSLVYEEEKLSRQVLSMSYLSLRLALVEVLDIDLALIFDENLAFFDEERMAAALKVFTFLAKEKQVLLFTSSKVEKSVLSELNLCYNYIQL
ncbi:MAG: AAA family ATPase [Eubacteriales bacterium]|uniref:ATP-binding protein n=1 Tax=Fenollaria sp. TaxID=1965292 RepID=UPI002A74A287|nr:AAA family ATPase [Fenollaria sp.]MDD7339079.1 AAA family ATPase [Eubacteriales bacterium]MDY3105731.1 AAA family ATPase [Fenollaria sp.]